MLARPCLFAAMLSSVLMSAALLAQSTDAPAERAEFEVAAVRLHTSADQRTSMVAQPGGRFVATNVPLRLVIRTAFQLQDDQVVGGPEWLDSDRFDIEARAPDPTAALPDDLLEMLQSLLADRFGFTSHRETRELPIFALERAREDGALGPGLRPTACPDLALDLTRPEPCARIGTAVGSLSARGISFDQLVPYLAPYLNRVTVDRTGLEGRYDLDLEWTPEPPAAAGGPALAAGDPGAVSIFTALQEQLGLRLDSTRGPVEVLVIDTLAHPTSN